MLRWTLIAGAFVTWVTVLGCVMWPADAPAQRGSHVALEDTPAPSTPVGTITSRTGLPYVAVAMQIQRTDWIDKYKANMDEIAALGADSVLLVIDTRTENIHSARIWLDTRYTATPEQLGDLIRHAKSKKLRVILMPVVLLDNPGEDWRGKIQPDEEFGGWSEWFKSYRDMIKQFSWVAEGNGVDVLVVGSELVSTESHVDEWIETIREVRKLYHGRITYSSNWDHYDKVKFWDHLDLIGLNSYWSFGKKEKNPDPSLDQIMTRWKEIQSDLLPFVQKSGKPLLFLEIGWFSQNNVAYEPWDYTREQPIDLDLQKRLYEGFFRSWWGNPLLGGFCIWEWPPVEGGPNDGGYTPKNKPAEKVIREFLAKPRWEVK
ncbi:MAG TPA: hypothetical protein VH518_08430 [Tepidisphaeraceae bacterium]|jgi:hypothetical protein